nr:protein timeless-like [Parasteatoda tepidariorum]
MMPVPVIPFTCEQRAILKNKSFVLLLQKIGLHPGTSDCLIYPRIPLSWTVDILFSVAARLGPIKKEKMKFSYEELLDAFSKIDPLTRKEINCLALPPLSSCCTMSSWLAMVQQNKEHFISTKGNN